MGDALLRAMLGARPELTAEGDVFTVADGADVELLLTTQGGHVPLTRVEQIALGASFLTVSTQDADYLLPFERIAGLKVTRRKAEARTGFRR